MGKERSMMAAGTDPVIAIIGDGAMATVCAQVLAGKAREVRVWGRDAQRLAQMNSSRENARYLPGVQLHERIRFIADDAAVFEGAALIVCAIPTQYIRTVLGRLAGHVPPGVPVVSVAKGIELETFRRPSEIIAEALEAGRGEGRDAAPTGGGRAIAALSGPCIAGEVARQMPAVMVTAAQDAPGGAGGGGSDGGGEALARWVQELFATPYLRIYRNQDLRGVEFAGAMKNVIAIAAGILEGMRAGYNAKAALLTRGLVEITRLGVALGAEAETFAGLAGLGDLVTTCFSPEGRNRSFGERIGRGEKSQEILASMPGVVEGVPTCRSMVQLARDRGIGMPISEGLHAVLFEGRDPQEELTDLMTRALKSE
jgi:glycerol-3-phosphate dehydrogenase (NAD(P)+)